MSNKPAILICVIFLLQLNLAAHTNNAVLGKVINAQTKDPVANVNVYLAHTLMGTTTSETGEFILKNIPPGTYDLVVSHIQYERIIEQIVITGNNKHIESMFSLEPRIFQLPDVLVEDNSSDWWDYFNSFKRELLGYTEFSDSCEILNPTVINFADNDIKTFNAYSTEPIYIINKALGYRVTYELEYFQTDGINTKYSGIPYFQELSTESDSIRNVWEMNREAAYVGSFRDFLAQCCYQYIHKDSLLISNTKFTIDERWDDHDPKSEKRLWILVNDMNEYITEGNNETCLNFYIPKNMRTIQKSKQLLMGRGYWFSRFEQVKDTVAVDILGRNFDRFGFHMIGGYWSRQRLADALPFEYTLED